jgi:hypothetical protein
MKIQLDTTNKTVKIEENVKVSKLIATLKKLLPEDWKEFTLETHTTINNWGSPYIIKEYPVCPTYPWYPWYCSSTNSLNSGVYNVEC